MVDINKLLDKAQEVFAQENYDCTWEEYLNNFTPKEDDMRSFALVYGVLIFEQI